MGMYKEDYCPDPFEDLEDLEDFYKKKETQLDKITGVAEYINTRATSFGTMYSLKVNGTNYSLGKTDPTAKFQIVKGDAVEFTAEQNAKGYWDIKGPVKKLGGEAASASRPAAAAAVAASASYRAVDDNKQKTISRQAARNTAVQFMTLLQSVGALPAAKTKGGNFDLLRETLDKLTDEFYNDSLNPQPVSSAPSTGAETAAAGDGEWTE